MCGPSFKPLSLLQLSGEEFERHPMLFKNCTFSQCYIMITLYNVGAVDIKFLDCKFTDCKIELMYRCVHGSSIAAAPPHHLPALSAFPTPFRCALSLLQGCA